MLHIILYNPVLLLIACTGLYDISGIAECIVVDRGVSIYMYVVYDVGVTF